MTRISHHWLAIFSAAGLFASAPSGQAHLTYPTARDFGVFADSPRSVSISGQATKSYGWADGTDADWAKQDDQRYFKFTITSATTITISVTALDSSVFLPGFSLYSGVGHAATDSAHPDFDGSTFTQAYLQSLSGPTREGAFDALHTFQIGNDSVAATQTAPAYTGSLITLTYIGHAADGTSANYGPAAGIQGDGVADGFVTATFTLAPGDYTLAVAGANYYSQSDTVARGFSVNLTSVPEPSTSCLLIATAMLGTARWRLRRKANSNRHVRA